LRHYLIRNLKVNLSNESFTVAAALLLGQKEYLQTETQTLFANSGTMHILAVSGLHVGILYALLIFLLPAAKTNKLMYVLKALIILSALWSYAAVTGFSPSVLRACLMLTLYELGILLYKPRNTYVIVYAAALFLLLFNPNLLLQVSFQLSFTAVISILFFYPRLYEFINHSNRVLDYFCKIICVTIAVQFGTLPLSAFYFKTFSIYFLLSNLLAIPAASIIFSLGTAFFFLNLLNQTLAKSLAILLDGTIQTLNKMLELINSLPYANYHFTSVEIWDLVLIFSGLICLGFWLVLTKKIHFNLLKLILSLFLCFQIYKEIKNINHYALTIYHHKKELVIAIKEGKNISLNKALDSLDTSFLKYTLQIEGQNISSYQTKKECSFQNYYELLNKKIVLIDKENHIDTYKDFKLDFLLVSDSPFINFDELLETIQFNRIIFAANNNDKALHYYQQQCKIRGIETYSIKEKGAFVEEFYQTFIKGL